MIRFISGNCSAAKLSIQASTLRLAAPSSQPGSVVCLFEDALRFLVQDHPAVDEGIAGGFEDGGVLPGGVKEEGPDLAVTRVGGRESKIEVGNLIVEPQLEEENRVGFGRPAGAGFCCWEIRPSRRRESGRTGCLRDPMSRRSAWRQPP